MKKIIILAGALLTGVSANAQDAKHGFFDDWSLGLSLNNYIFKGDVNGLHSIEETGVDGEDIDYKNEKKFDLGFGARLAKQLSPAFDLGLEYNGFGFSGVGTFNNQEDVRSIDVDFHNLTLNSRLSLTRLSEHRGAQPKFNLFVEAGYGLIWANHTTYVNELKDSDRSEDLDTDLDENERFQTIPVGVGIEYKVCKRLAVGLTSKIYILRSDAMDGISVGNPDMLWQNSLSLNYDLTRLKKGAKGYKWNNSFADMSSGVVSNKENIDKLDSKLNSLNDRVSKVESALANKVDKKAWKDTDGDGVHNDDDMEANTPKGTLVNFQGVSISKAVKGNGAAYFTPVYFNVGKSNLSRDQYVALANMALYLQDHANQNVTLIGYADKTGSASFNQKLSAKRTESVKNVLVNKFGIDASRISLENRGETELKSKLDRINRRVDFVLK